MVSPATIAETVEAVRSYPSLKIQGLGSQAAWCIQDPSAAVLSTTKLSGIARLESADQVVVVRAGTPLDELNAELRSHGQCLPLGPSPFPGTTGTVGGAISMALPHTLEGRTGAWRDWLLGLTLITASGEIVKCGSSAVKNVAGYDVQRLILGARGTIGIVVEAILRTYPVRALPTPELAIRGAVQPGSYAIHRVRRTDFGAAFQGYTNAVGDPETGTIWGNFDPTSPPTRYPGDWIVRTVRGPDNRPEVDATVARFMARATEIFDPTAKFGGFALTSRMSKSE